MELKTIDIWKNIKLQLNEELDSDTYENYISSIDEIYKETPNLIFLIVDNFFIKTRIQNSLLSRMNELLSQYVSTQKYFVLITKDEIAKENQTSSPAAFSKVGPTGLNPNYTFRTFVVGTSNRLAHRYALLASEQLAAAANPIYIFGDVGLGKTHLMQAIGNGIIEDKPELKVKYVRTQDFVEKYVKCNTGEEYEKFSKEYSSIDVLLVDDIQFLESKKQCQLEFFKIFERLTEDKKLIVLTSDRKASDLKELMPRLTSRFEWGISLDISKPDKEHRVGILKAKLKQELANPSLIPDEVVDYIATICESNIRELEGALRRVLFYCEGFGCDYNLENAKEALKNIISFVEIVEGNHVIPSEKIKKLINVVGSYFRLDQDDLLSNSRKKELVYARQICWYLLRNKYDMTYQKIGDIFNGKDHSTIMHGVEFVNNSLKADEQTQKNVDNILRKIGKNPNEI